jgi:hypothetical protein
MAAWSEGQATAALRDPGIVRGRLTTNERLINAGRPGGEIQLAAKKHWKTFKNANFDCLIVANGMNPQKGRAVTCL